MVLVVVVVVRLRHIPATTTPRYARAPRRNLTFERKKGGKKGDHKGIVGTLFLSGKFEMNGYLIGVGGFHGENKGNAAAPSQVTGVRVLFVRQFRTAGY